MKKIYLTISLITVLGLVGHASGQAPVARVGDVTRLQGQGINILVGYGLVTGRDGTVYDPLRPGHADAGRRPETHLAPFLGHLAKIL